MLKDAAGKWSPSAQEDINFSSIEGRADAACNSEHHCTAVRVKGSACEFGTHQNTADEM